MLQWWRQHRKRVAARQSVLDLERRFAELQKILKPDAFIEVGAYEASASLQMRELFPKIRVVAFEAHPANYAHFSSTVDFVGKQIEYLNIAATEKSGDVTFRVLQRHKDILSQRGSILEMIASDDMPVAIVAGVSLDEFFRQAIPQRPSLWIDVEGANRDVLTGAVSLLDRAVSVYIEVEERPRWKDQWLSADVCRFLNDRGMVEVSRDSRSDEQYNILFERRPLS